MYVIFFCWLEWYSGSSRVKSFWSEGVGYRGIEVRIVGCNDYSIVVVGLVLCGLWFVGIVIVRLFICWIDIMLCKVLLI